MKLRAILLFVVVGMLLSGCDWVRGTLGMPTSKDIKNMKAKLEQMAKESEGDFSDSLNILDTTSVSNNNSDASSISAASNNSFSNNTYNQSAQAASVSAEQRYYIVLGCFKSKRNADSMISFVKQQGYSPSFLDLKNGYRMVVLEGFSKIGLARKKIDEIADTEICPYDVWVYDTRSNLHN